MTSPTVVAGDPGQGRGNELEIKKATYTHMQRVTPQVALPPAVARLFCVE